MTRQDEMSAALTRVCLRAVEGFARGVPIPFGSKAPEVRTSPRRPHSFVLRTPEGEFYYVKVTKSSWRDH